MFKNKSKNLTFDQQVCSSILYIQMELCTSTLRKWIEKRNASSSSGGGKLYFGVFFVVEYLSKVMKLDCPITPFRKSYTCL